MTVAFPGHTHLLLLYISPMRGSKRGTGGLDLPRLENDKNIGFIAIPCPDPLVITKLTGQHSMSGNQRPASETPFKWRFAGEPMMARF